MKEAATKMAAIPTYPPVRTSRAGCRLSFASLPNQVAITIDSTAIEKQRTAFAAGPYHKEPDPPRRANNSAVGALAMRKPRKRTGRMLRSCDGDTSATSRMLAALDGHLQEY